MDKGMLNEATSSDDSPIPGYMLKEIAQQTISSYPACTQLIEFLAQRIKKTNRSTKYKCLVIIKYVCRSGRPEFKREVTRILDVIKECLQYKGDIDPLRGDEPNKQVRDAAKEAVDAIFDSQMPTTTSAVASSNRIQGFSGGYDYGPSGAAAPSASSGMLQSISSAMSNMLGDQEAAYVGHPGATDMNMDPSRRVGGGALPGAPAFDQPPRRNSGMQGFGNPNMPDAREDKSWYDKISSAAAAAVHQYSSNTESRVHFASEGAPTDYNTYTSNRGTNPATRSTAYNPNSYPVGSAPSVWGNNGAQAPVPTSGGIVPDIPIRPGLSGRVGGAAVDGTYEQGLVASLCEPGGMKAVPPEDKLKAFLDSAPTLSPDMIGACLEAQLNEDAWQSRVKALIVIANLAANRGCHEHAQWWRADERRDELLSVAQQDSKASVRTQASKTCQSLGIHVAGGAEHAPSHASHAHHASPSSAQPSLLLDDFDSTPAAPAQQHTGVSLMHDMGMGYPAAAPPAPLAAPEDDDGLFSGMAVAAHAPQSHTAVSAPAPAPAPVIDQFAGLTLQPTPLSAPVAPTPAPAPAPAAPSGFDAFSLIEPEPLVPATQPAASSKGGIDLSDLDPTFNKNNTASAGMPPQGYPQGFPVGVGGAAPYGGMPVAMGPGGAYPGQVPVQNVLSRPMPMPAPMQMGPRGAVPYYGAPPAPGAYPGYPGMVPGMAPVAPAGGMMYAPMQSMPMGSVGAVRKTIPDSQQQPGAVAPAGGSSGFSFMGGAGGSQAGSGDSFSFVSDVMKSSR